MRAHTLILRKLITYLPHNSATQRQVCPT